MNNKELSTDIKNILTGELVGQDFSGMAQLKEVRCDCRSPYHYGYRAVDVMEYIGSSYIDGGIFRPPCFEDVFVGMYWFNHRIKVIDESIKNAYHVKQGQEKTSQDGIEPPTVE